jgi:CheY-like chemotaxis protein
MGHPVARNSHEATRKKESPRDRRRKRFCIFVGSALGKTGRHEVISATEPLRGIIMARVMMPDLILLDLTMPYMDGSQVAETLLEDAVTNSIPIVFVTGLITKTETERRHMVVAGRTFVAKPVTGDELLQAVGRVLV